MERRKLIEVVFGLHGTRWVESAKMVCRICVDGHGGVRSAPGLSARAVELRAYPGDFLCESADPFPLVGPCNAFPLGADLEHERALARRQREQDRQQQPIVKVVRVDGWVLVQLVQCVGQPHRPSGGWSGSKRLISHSQRSCLSTFDPFSRLHSLPLLFQSGVKRSIVATMALHYTLHLHFPRAHSKNVTAPRPRADAAVQLEAVYLTLSRESAGKDSPMRETEAETSRQEPQSIKDARELVASRTTSRIAQADVA